jgi:hypothetical protein
MKMKKNEETSNVVIDGQEYSLYDYSYSMDKAYIKEPTRKTNEPFQNLVPFEFDKDGE